MSSRTSTDAQQAHRRSTSTTAASGSDSAADGGGGRSSRVRVIGDYALGKTLGAGSMGKVKLAHHLVTGERVAIKIVPRTPAPDPSLATTPDQQKAAAREASKELRTVREAAMSLLVHHPYICGMRELLVQPSQYLLVLEYVAGGQMLDYIIAHGRLRERVARKFARQVGSALAYCHANSIVHRDLKIENILISASGDIRLIDFGLSNLYNPYDRLSTFAGSLYFAAPELLNARPYTGPEVDVWSLGVVLYVLVCGRVPFDDQSMPALHAKIKRGQVEYPAWLSADCKSLLGRMLVTSPQQRATLTEVLAHPWMSLGYTAPVSTYIPHRVPLRADELDPRVVRGMAGFEFGSDEEVGRKLRDVLTSEPYLRACARLQGTSTSHSTFATSLGSTSSLSIDGITSTAASSVHDTTSHGPTGTGAKTPPVAGSGGSAKSRRFSALHLGRRLFSSTSQSTPSSPNPTRDASPSTPTPDVQNGHPRVVSGGSGGGSSPPSDDLASTLDPTRGFHPLISVYFMVREKMERERMPAPTGTAAAVDAASVASGRDGVQSSARSTSSSGHKRAGTGVAMEKVIERASAEGTNYAGGDASSSNAAPGSSAPSRPHAPVPMTPLTPTGAPSPLTPTGKRIGGPGSSGMMLNLMGTASPVEPTRKSDSPTTAAPASTPTKSHRRSLSASSTGMPSSPSQTTPRPPPQQQQQQPPQQQRPVPPVLAIPPVPQTQSQQTPTPRSPVLQQTTPTRARTIDDRTLPLPLPPKAAPRASMDADSIRSAATAPPNSNFPSQIQHPQVSKLIKAGPGPSKPFTTSDVPPSPLADPRAGGFARRFGSLAGRRRTSSLITAPPDLPGAQTSGGQRRDSTADEVLSDSEAVGPGGRRRSAFSSRFSAAPSTPSTLHSRDSTGASGYSSSRDSGTLGRWGTIGRKFKGAKVGSKASAAGPVPGLAVQTPGEEVERHLGEPLAAPANASAVEPVVVEEPEAEGDDEHEGSTVHSHASPVLRSAAAAMPAVVVQPPSQPSGAQQLPQDHHHVDSHGQGHGRKLHKASKDGHHHHDDEHDHHDEQFRAVRLKGTFSVATTSTKSAKSLHATVRRTLERMGIPFREIVGGFEVAHEPSILNGAAAAAAIAASPVIAHTPLNGTRKSMMEPNGEDGATDVEGMGTGTTKTFTRARPHHLRKKGSKISLTSSNHGANGKERDRQHSQSPVVQRVSEKSSVEGKLGAGATGIARKASTRRGEKDERELPSRPVTGGSMNGNVLSTPIANTGDATLNGHHHTAERPMTMVVPASASADPGTHSASSSLLHLADHARRAARTPSPSPGRSRGREDHIVHGPDGDREDVEGVFERWSPLGVRFEIHIVKVPILPLRGVQFRRVAGDGWQYHMLARRVLAELKL